MNNDHRLVLWGVIGAYMVLMAVAGSYYARYIRTADAFFRAGRSVPWWAAGISIYKANFTAYTFTGIASLVYIDGLSGLLLETGPALAFLLAALVFVPRWYRLGLTSPPEYLEARFNAPTRRVFSVLGIATSFIASGMRLYAVSKLVESILGLPLLPTILVAGAVMIIYTSMGGWWAVVVTDILQFLILFVAAIPLFCLALAAVVGNGGWAEFAARMPLHFGSFPNPDHGRTLGWLLAFWFTYLLDYNGDWGVIQMICSTRTEKEAKKGLLLATGLAIPHAFLLLGPCFVARVLWSAEIADPALVGQAETVYGKVALKLLPAGMIGVVAAAMLAATMSTLSISWSVRSTSLVNDLYVAIIRPRASDREKLLMGRLGVILVGGVATAVAVLVALYSSGLFALAQSLVGFVVIPVILPLLLGLLLKGANPWGGLAGLSAGLVWVVLNRTAPGLVGLAASLPFEYEVLISAAWIFAVMLTMGRLPATEIQRAKVDGFFGRMRQVLPDELAKTDAPSPGPVIGALAIAVAVLIGLLSLLPQSPGDRLLTLAAALALVVVGCAARRLKSI